MKKIGVTHFDIGAQSTAPLNIDAGEKEEINRLDQLLTPEFIKELNGLSLSIDTFRPAVIDFVLNKLCHSSLRSFTWNDISGRLTILFFHS